MADIVMGGNIQGLLLTELEGEHSSLVYLSVSWAREFRAGFSFGQTGRDSLGL